MEMDYFGSIDLLCLIAEVIMIEKWCPMAACIGKYGTPLKELTFQ